MSHSPLCVRVWGDFACWTRPEFHAERTSYAVPTPSGVRGILEAIFWKPEIAWEVRAIKVLRPIHYFSVLRNETNNKAVVATAQKWAREGGGYFAEEDRAQRHTLALRDVAYFIMADIVLKPHASVDVAAYRDQFRRRVESGKCHHRTYLGCREFAAFFGPADLAESPIRDTTDLGRMLFDIDYAADGSGRGRPRFFDARLVEGVLHVDPRLYRKEV
jgi:CRISPR-associated protein Cas5d